MFKTQISLIKNTKIIDSRFACVLNRYIVSITRESNLRQGELQTSRLHRLFWKCKVERCEKVPVLRKFLKPGRFPQIHYCTREVRFMCVRRDASAIRIRDQTREFSDGSSCDAGARRRSLISTRLSFVGLYYRFLNRIRYLRPMWRADAVCADSRYGARKPCKPRDWTWCCTRSKRRYLPE